MASKSNLLTKIAREFSEAQKEDTPLWNPPPGKISFPPLLSVGNGEHLQATEGLLTAVGDYASVLLRNSATLRAAFSIKEFRSIVGLVFGRALNSMQSTAPDGTILGSLVDASIQEEIDARKRDTDLLIGCWLFEDASAYPISVGPVTFQPRLRWLAAQIATGTLSKTTGRRLQRTWSGERLNSRKSGFDNYKERAIIEAVDRCSIVCQVKTHGLSSDLVRQKGLMAARMAMATLSLPWENSQQTLERMNMIYDGPPRSRHYAITTAIGGFGSGTSIVTTPFGQHSQEPLKPVLAQFQPTFDVVGESLTAYVNPHATIRRPKIANAVFLSLWWFHEGCRESSDQMAVTAFAASLDALAAGGTARGIKELIEARLGVAPSTALMSDGRTAGSVVDAVYKARSCLIHGSSGDYLEDWTSLRTTAMVVARLLLLQVTYWLQKNPNIDNVKALRK